MTIIIPFSRALSQQLPYRSHHVLTRLNAATSLLRASYSTQNSTGSKPAVEPTRRSCVFASVRTYATSTAGKATGRPKAHTGKTAAKKVAVKPKTATKASTSSKKKPVRKAKAKPKPKPKPKPKQKAPSRTALKLKATADRKDLKARALLSEPKKLPDNTYLVYFVENSAKKGSRFADSAQTTRQIAADYKSLSPLERERLNHTANENKATNETNYKQWVSKFTPLQVRQANLARKRLSAQKKASSKSKAAYVPQIKDDRQVKQPGNAYSLFVTDRFRSGDFRNMALTEAASLISKEWKELSSSGKQGYLEQSEQQQAHYIEEYKRVYGEDPSVVKAAKAAQESRQLSSEIPPSIHD